MSNSSRFSKYNAGDLNPLWKPLQGESRTARLIGCREYANKFEEDAEPVPVLDLEDIVTHEAFSWMASTWHAREQLELVDPADGETITITRMGDKGPSYQWKIEREADRLAAKADDVLDRLDPRPATVPADDDIPF